MARDDVVDPEEEKREIKCDLRKGKRVIKMWCEKRKTVTTVFGETSPYDHTSTYVRRQLLSMLTHPP